MFNRLIMKRIFLLLGMFFLISGVYSQKLEVKPLSDDADSFEVRVRNFEKLFADSLEQDKQAQMLKSEKEMTVRAEWRRECSKRLLTKKLTEILRQIGVSEGGGLWVTFYVDSKGKVITVKFMISSTVYVKLPFKMLRELYNMAMKETLDPSCYVFDEKHTYAVDGTDLMKRAVADDLKKDL